MGPARLIWRGEIHDVDLGVPVGREPAFKRPGVVVSSDLLNNGPGDLVALVPVTTNGYGLRSHIELEPGEGSGLERTSHARCDQVRVISTRRLVRCRGTVSAQELRAIEQALRFVLDL